MSDMKTVIGIVSEGNIPGYSVRMKKVTVYDCPFCGGEHVHYRGVFDHDNKQAMVREAQCFKGEQNEYLIRLKYTHRAKYYEFDG